MTKPNISDVSYRPEIQGLRTVGAVLVATFHIWFGKISGGVDVFFVVSGFLITGSLIRRWERSGTVDVVAFWRRIAQRIVPVSVIVLLLTLTTALLYLPQSRCDGFLAELFFSSLHLENIKLMSSAVDYLAREEAQSPVQQFWALSVQVQFYLIWPFLVMLGATLVARGAGRPTAVFASLFGAAALVSLAYSVVTTHEDPAPAYFDPIARIWEFALGGLVAVALPSMSVPYWVRIVAGWIGLALVVSCGFVLPASAEFPGHVALWPTLGATLVLLGAGTNDRLGVGRVLAAKPFVSLGELSFSFYLWHWPILIFALILTRQTHLDLVQGLAVITIALLGAAVTTRWVEQPILRSKTSHGRRVQGAVLTVACATPLAIALGAIHSATTTRDDKPVFASGGIVAPSSVTAFDARLPLVPGFSEVKKVRGHTGRKGCNQNHARAEPIFCIFGAEENATKTIAIVGGSHSLQWMEAFEQLAKENHWRVVNITKNACPFEVSKLRTPPCVEWNDKIHEVLKKIRPDVVFTTSTRSDLKGPRTEGGSEAIKAGRREIVPEGYLKQWERLANSGISVIALRDNPRMNFDVPECLESHFPDIMKCARPRNKLLEPIDPAAKLPSKPPNVSFIDLSDRFCDALTCYSVIGNMIVYRDKHHVSAAFARSLAPILGERMRQVRPDLFGIDSIRSAHRPSSVVSPEVAPRDRQEM